MICPISNRPCEYSGCYSEICAFQPKQPTPSIEPVDKKFYCKEWNNVGYVCEEQCAACKKHDQPTPEELAVDYEGEARIVFPDDMMPETDAPTINALRHGFVKARQMSVPTNDQRGIMNELIEWIKQFKVHVKNLPIDATIQKATELLSQQKDPLPDAFIEKLKENIRLHMNPYNLGDMGETSKMILQLIDKYQQKEMDGKVTRGNMLSEIVGSFTDLEYEKDAPIDPLKAREIAEKAIQWAEENYYITYNKSTSNSKKIYLDTHYPIEKEGDDKADNQK